MANYIDRTDPFTSLVAQQTAMRREDIEKGFNTGGNANAGILGGLLTASGQGAQNYMQGRLQGQRFSEESARNQQQMQLAGSGEERAKNAEQRLAEEHAFTMGENRANQGVLNGAYKPGVSVRQAQATQPLKTGELSNNIAQQNLALGQKRFGMEQAQFDTQMQDKKIADAVESERGKILAAQQSQQDVSNYQATKASAGNGLVLSSNFDRSAPKPVHYDRNDMLTSLRSQGFDDSSSARVIGKVLTKDPGQQLIQNQLEDQSGLTDFNKSYQTINSAIQKLSVLQSDYEQGTGVAFESNESKQAIESVASLLDDAKMPVLAEGVRKSLGKRVMDVLSSGDKTTNLAKIIESARETISRQAAIDLRNQYEAIRSPDMKARALPKMQILKTGGLGGDNKSKLVPDGGYRMIQTGGGDEGGVSHHRRGETPSNPFPVQQQQFAPSAPLDEPTKAGAWRPSGLNPNRG